MKLLHSLLQGVLICSYIHSSIAFTLGKFETYKRHRTSTPTKFLSIPSDASLLVSSANTAKSQLLLSSHRKKHESTTSEHSALSNNNNKSGKGRRFLSRFWRKFDTIEEAGISSDEVRISGVFQRIKDLHNPKTYLVLALVAGFRWEWCFRNPYYWFGVAFCVKWYRARYVFKIPVWDRQPNWNNIITSKEQEKDLKAFTCKKCGSTIFIAKTREFFFEGNTGIGGLGCFACGAKGKENFIMDRERIVEDVGDMDDYFEYERPLDFVSAAERRKLLKEAGGDLEAANQLLVERATGTSDAETGESSSAMQTANSPSDVLDAEIVEPEDAEIVEPEEAVEEAAEIKDEEDQKVEEVPETSDIKATTSESEPVETETVAETDSAPPKAEKKKKKKKKPAAVPAPEPVPSGASSTDDDDDIFDLLGMDD